MCRKGIGGNLMKKRAMGIEPTTSTLGRSHSTAELRPLKAVIMPHGGGWSTAWRIERSWLALARQRFGALS